MTPRVDTLFRDRPQHRSLESPKQVLLQGRLGRLVRRPLFLPSNRGLSGDATRALLVAHQIPAENTSLHRGSVFPVGAVLLGEPVAGTSKYTGTEVHSQLDEQPNGSYLVDRGWSMTKNHRASRGG